MKHFKLLTPTPAFAERIASSVHASSLLHSRLVYSWLAFRSRLDLGASTRGIGEDVGLHPKSVASAIRSLGDLVQRRSNEWIAAQPPESLFIPMKLDEQPNHWADCIAYTMLYLPRKGAKIQYAATVRRFGLNHAIVWSFLLSNSKNKGVIRNFTFAGAGKLFDLDPKTVRSIVDDLVWLKLVSREDCGRCSDLTILPVTNDHLALFEPKPLSPERKKVEPVEKQPRAVRPNYELQNDIWDLCRRLCEPLIPQKTCESIIVNAIRLGDTPEVCFSSIAEAKERHEANILSGKVAKGNFAKFVSACFETRIHKLEERLKEEEEERKRDEYLSSDGFRAKQKKLEQEAAADPMHPRHILSQDGILDRVSFSGNGVNAYVASYNFMLSLKKHIRQFLKSANPLLLSDDETKHVDKIEALIMKPALASLNRYYLQPQKASFTEFEQAIKTAMSKHTPGIPPLFSATAQSTYELPRKLSATVDNRTSLNSEVDNNDFQAESSEQMHKYPYALF